MRLVILARKGDREIHWKCTDIREYRSRREAFVRQGFTVD